MNYFAQGKHLEPGKCNCVYPGQDEQDQIILKKRTSFKPHSFGSFSLEGTQILISLSSPHVARTGQRGWHSMLFTCKENNFFNI